MNNCWIGDVCWLLTIDKSQPRNNDIKIIRMRYQIIISVLQYYSIYIFILPNYLKAWQIISIYNYKQTTMQIQMQIPHILEAVERKDELIKGTNDQKEYKQTKYRWVIVVLMSLSLLVLGIVNNAVIPLEHKITIIYNISEGKVTLSVILSFLIFSIVNFPANHIIDTKGLRISFLIGTSLYTVGSFLYVFINKSYYFVIFGTVFMGLGQPFIMNCPAKVAAFWFSPKNRALSTSIMVGVNLLGMGLGFLIPTLAVKESSNGQKARKQIWQLYAGYFILSSLCFLLNYFFMKNKPSVSPSESADAIKVSSPIQSLRHLKSNKNILLFFTAYALSYGTFVSFASNSNFIIKPYGYSDIQIASNAISLMLIGTIGAISFSIYIKKTYNFKLIIRLISIGSFTMLSILCIWLNTFNVKILTTIIISIMGFIITPVVPISYDLGCELSFPMGEAQVTGLLNGGALLWAFISSSFVAAVIGFGTQKQSLITMVTLSLFILFGSILFFFVKIILRRHEYERNQSSSKTTETPVIQNPIQAQGQQPVKEYSEFTQQIQGNTSPIIL